MIQVIVDNNSLSAEFTNGRTMGELVEYIKSTIDPSNIIVSLTKDDIPLSENDWKSNLSSLSNSRLEVKTGTKSDFIKLRLDAVGNLVGNLIDRIQETSVLFKSGSVIEGNKIFSTCLEDLNALISWLHSIISMDSDFYANELAIFSNQVKDFRYVAGQLQQQQLFQSWWALGETLTTKLIPLLESMKTLGIDAGKKL